MMMMTVMTMMAMMMMISWDFYIWNFQIELHFLQSVDAEQLIHGRGKNTRPNIQAYFIPHLIFVIYSRKNVFLLNLSLHEMYHFWACDKYEPHHPPSIPTPYLYPQPPISIHPLNQNQHCAQTTGYIWLSLWISAEGGCIHMVISPSSQMYHCIAGLIL